jgi:hypothetical protein
LRFHLIYLEGVVKRILWFAFAQQKTVTHPGGGILDVTAAPYDAMAVRLCSSKNANVHLGPIQ